VRVVLGQCCGEGRSRVAASVLQAVLVGATLAVLGEPLGSAALAGAGFLALTLTIEGSEVFVGDYAGNLVLGLLTVVFGAWLSTAGAVVVGAVAVLVGAWFAVDGVQHLRYGVERTAVVRGIDEGSEPLRALPRLLAGRLLEPFRLPDSG
jgi:hypothetical protein